MAERVKTFDLVLGARALRPIMAAISTISAAKSRRKVDGSRKVRLSYLLRIEVLVRRKRPT